MKRIAVSLGSLSLVLMQNGHCEPADPLEAFPSAMSDVVSDQHQLQNQQEQYDQHASSQSIVVSDEQTTENLIDENDEFAFLETDPQELEDELLSLEQELEIEQSSLVEMEDLASQETIDSDAAVLSNAESLETATLNPALEEQQPMSLEKTSETLSQEEEAALSDKLLLVDQLPMAVETIQSPAFENTTSLIALNEPSNELDLEIKEEMENEVAPAEIAEGAKVAPASIPSASLTIKSPSKSIEISLSQVFSGSPMIYLVLLFLSVVSVALWLFNLISLQKYAATSNSLMKNVRNKLMSNHYDEVLSLCKEDKSFFSKMMSTGVSSRKYGLQFMLESMKSEGKRASVSFWQRLNILHDIAIIAPMIGLLGTVLGMFYAFYDLNRSFESISSLFDGLGVSVGTTVAGIFVAILAMVLHSLSKYRLVKSLSFVENEAVKLAHLIDSNKNSN